MQEVPLSPTIAGIAESATLAVDARAKAMKKQGLDVVGFGVGEPDFDTPEHIKQACVAALKAGKTKYPPAGTPEIRAAVARKFKLENGLDYEPSQIVVSNGAKHSLFNAVLAMVRSGDYVLIPSPYWVTYPEQVKIAGGIPIFVPTSAAEGYRLRPDVLANNIPRNGARLLILNSPNNPTGSVMDDDDLLAIGRSCVERNISVISDEVYEKLVYNGRRHTSILKLVPELQNTSVVINAVSKAYAMTGWRIGYAAAPRSLAAAMDRFQSQATSGPCTMSQEAAVVALSSDQSCVEDMRRQFDLRRKLMVERVRAIPGLDCPEPDGAFYVFVSFAELFGKTLHGVKITGSLELCSVILDKAHVAVVPGIAFGDDACFRLSYATSTERITEGLDRIAKLIQQVE